MRLLTMWLILFVFLLGSSGCISLRSGSLQSESLRPSAAMRFGDIPSPAGFKIASDKSFILESGGVRAGILKYTGRANAEDVVLFYKTQMPVHNWALLNVLEYGDRMLNFERENESCVVTIKAKGKRVEVFVSLAPKFPMPTPAPEVKVEREEFLEIEPRK